MKDDLIAHATGASVPVRLIDSPSQEQLRELYRRAAVLAFPVEEDFGLVPVEAMACGTPVLALNRGGASESVIDGETGALVDSYDLNEYAEAFERAIMVAPGKCRAQAEEFSAARFSALTDDWIRGSSGGA